MRTTPRKLEWVKQPRTRKELMEKTLDEVAMAYGQSGNVKSISENFDFSMLDVGENAKYAWNSVQEFAEKLGDDPVSVAQIMYCMGFLTGALYSERDDHVWEENRGSN